ncbi:unnamed protein product [Rhizoctonia solani]|uniref:Transmembrane protein n=1 Tax=Rhizoctonia solani TaxID=456999 RepID=A0A8H3HZ36_9AGAM|nr:unnamed protein product [Rhizoctonia solani]
MPQGPALKDETGHPYPNGHRWFYFTILLFVLALPSLIVFNIITQGSELVPSLQPTFTPENKNLESWWGTRHLPERLRPGLPQCEPQALGRGDIFRLSASMFDYTVMSTWNTTKMASATEVQEQERVEYHGESFRDCHANTARYDYSLGDQTHSITVGVFCPGYDGYRIQISMQTTMTFAWDLTKDFIGQYYGPGLDLLNLTETSNYRQSVLAVLEVISTDALTILHRQHLPVHPLSMRVYFGEIYDNATLPDETTTSALTYANGTQLMDYPEEAFIYINSIFNLVYAAIDAVNLDLGNDKPNMFRNASRLPEVIFSNKAAPGINVSEWALGSQSLYYGTIIPPYETWAEMLINGLPSNITVGNVQGMPPDSAMVTTYLCPVYQIKPLKSLLSSVFIGSVAMTSTVWSGWLLFVAILAKGQMEPRGQCECEDCQERRRDEQARQAAKVGIFSRLFRRSQTRPTHGSRDLEQPSLPSLPHKSTSDQSDASKEKP